MLFITDVSVAVATVFRVPSKEQWYNLLLFLLLFYHYCEGALMMVAVTAETCS